MKPARSALVRRLPALAAYRRPQNQLPHTVGPVELPVVHFSSRLGLRRLDPKCFGQGKANPRDRRGQPKVFTFLEGSPLGGDEALFRGALAYRGRVDGGRIYNLAAGQRDALGYFTNINREEADAKLRRRGYAGVLVGCPDGRQVGLLFHPLAVSEIPFRE